MNKGYYITDTSEKVEFEHSSLISIHSKNIITLVIPDGVTSVYCNSRLLKELILPDSVGLVRCDLRAVDIIKYKNSNVKLYLHI